MYLKINKNPGPFMSIHQQKTEMEPQNVQLSKQHFQMKTKMMETLTVKFSWCAISSLTREKHNASRHIYFPQPTQRHSMPEKIHRDDDFCLFTESFNVFPPIALRTSPSSVAVSFFTRRAMLFEKLFVCVVEAERRESTWKLCLSLLSLVCSSVFFMFAWIDWWALENLFVRAQTNVSNGRFQFFSLSTFSLHSFSRVLSVLLLCAIENVQLKLVHSLLVLSFFFLFLHFIIITLQRSCWKTSSDNLGDTILFLQEFDREAAEMCNRWVVWDTWQMNKRAKLNYFFSISSWLHPQRRDSRVEVCNKCDRLQSQTNEGAAESRVKVRMPELATCSALRHFTNPRAQRSPSAGKDIGSGKVWIGRR